MQKKEQRTLFDSIAKINKKNSTIHFECFIENTEISIVSNKSCANLLVFFFSSRATLRKKQTPATPVALFACYYLVYIFIQ